jgi:transglutaminase-like putative cysteine protease
MLLMLSVRPEREADLLTEHRIQLSNEIPSRDYRDLFGNVCTRLVAPAGLLEIRNEFIISDNGLPDEVSPRAEQWPIDSLPDEVLVYLLGSRYCDTEKLSQVAWQQFGSIVGGWQRVKAICDYVHSQLEFGYHHARPDRTASEGHQERRGVCRDFAHFGRGALPLLEYPGPLLHRISW